MSPRILVFDLENGPGLGYFWGKTYQTNIIKVHEPSRVMSFAAQWRGDKAIEYRSTFHDGRDAMLAKAWELLNEADAVISYNGRGHDTPHINTEFTREGLGIPSPYKEIDLYLVTRGKLKLHSNKLDYAAQEFQIGAKLQHEGFDLWLKCMAGDAKAWARFKRYNEEDVRLTGRLYERLLPLIPQSMHPNWNLYTDGDVCPNCGSRDLARRGVMPTTTAFYPRFSCRQCGKWSRGKLAVERADIRGAA